MFHHYSIACIFSADMVENVQTDFRTQVSNLFPILKYPEQSRTPIQQKYYDYFENI